MSEITKLINKKSAKHALVQALSLAEDLDVDAIAVAMRTKDNKVQYCFEGEQFDKVTLIGMLNQLSAHLEDEHIYLINPDHYLRVPSNEALIDEDEKVLLGALKTIKREGSAGVAVTILHDDDTRTTFFSRRPNVTHALIGAVKELGRNLMAYAKVPKRFDVFNISD